MLDGRAAKWAFISWIIILAFMQLSTSAHAENGIWLISNGDNNSGQCSTAFSPDQIVSCEAILKINFPSTITMPTSTGSFYKWEFNDLSAKSMTAIPYSFELQQDVNVTSPFPIMVDANIFRLKAVLDLNGTSCASVDWKDYNATSCYKTTKVQTGTGTSTTTTKQFVPFSFWNYKFNANTDYYVKLKGQKRADQNIDWIPTLAGTTYDKWAVWWNSSYAYKRKLTVTNNSTTTTLVDGNYAFRFQVTASALSSKQTDCDDVRMVYDLAGVLTEIDRNISNACNADFNVSSNIQANIAASGTDNNYWLYYGNASATASTTDENVLIWNDGNTTAWADFDNGLNGSGWTATLGTPTFTSTDANAYSGGALACYTSGGVKVSSQRLITPMNAGTVEFWLKIDSTPTGTSTFFYQNSSLDNFGLQDSGGLLYFNVAGNLMSIPDAFLATQVGQWHYWRLTFGPLGRYVYQDNNVLMFDVSKTQALAYDPNEATNQLNLCQQLGTWHGTAHTIDRFKITSGTQLNYPTIPMPHKDVNHTSILPSVSIGAEQSQNNQPVVYNDTTLKVDNALSGYLGKSNSQANDQNHSIQFQLYDDSNYLRAKIAYSTSKGAFTTQIIDLNLSAIQGASGKYSCSGSSLNFSGITTCFLDWNISGIADGNYFVDVNVYDSGGLNDTNSTANSFMLDQTTSSTTDDHNASGWQTTDANVHLTCADTNAGCYQTYYRVDGTDSFNAPYPAIWVINDVGGTVSRINPINNTVTATIRVGLNPRVVSVDLNGDVWVSNSSSNTVSRINHISNRVDVNVTGVLGPRISAVDANQNVWVTNYTGGKISRISPITNTVDLNVGVGSGPYGIAIDANQNAWVANITSKTVSRVNLTTGHTDINIGVGASPRGIAVDANGNIWVANYDSNTVSRINPMTNHTDINIGVGANPFGIAIDANQNVWVANFGSNKVSRINPVTNNMDLNVTVGSNPSGVSIDANQNVWVANFGSSNVSKINPNNNAVIATITVGANPFSLGDMTGFALQNFVLKKGWKAGSSDASGWKLDSNGWRMFGGLNDANILISTDGNHKIEYYSIDNAGNAESTKTIWVAVSKIDVNLSSPNGNNYFDYNHVRNSDGNNSIDFNVISANTNYLRARLYYSSSKGAYTNSIIDLNLSAMALNPTVDYNCGASSIDFSSTRACHADWNLSAIADGNYFVDVNVSYFAADLSGSFDLNSSGTAFVVDKTKPTTRWDGNALWQKGDTNIHLTCSDLYCSVLEYKKETSPGSGVYGAWAAYDKNILFTGDGNWGLQFDANDLASNRSDLNQQYVLIDSTAPVMSRGTPSGITNNTRPTFQVSVIDAGSGALNCDLNYYKRISGLSAFSLSVANQQVLVSGGVCQYAPLVALDTNDSAFVQFKARDNLGNIGLDLNAGPLTYQAAQSPAGPGGGGGGPTTIILKGTYSILKPTSDLNLNAYAGFKQIVIFTVLNNTNDTIYLQFSGSSSLDPYFVYPTVVQLGKFEQKDIELVLSVPSDEAPKNVSGTISINDGSNPTNYAVQLNINEPTGLTSFTLLLNQKTFGISNIVLLVIGILATLFLVSGGFRS